MSFSWIPIYKELASKIINYKDKQQDLINILKECKEEIDIKVDFGIKENIDPFTFFAIFNRGIRDIKRKDFLKFCKEKFNLNSEIPSDFDGIPLVNNLKSKFYNNQNDIKKLWLLAEFIIGQNDDIDIENLFEQILDIENIGLAKLTMGLFWLRPEQYLALDSKNISYLKLNAITLSWNKYLELLENVKTNYPDRSFSELSHDAYMSKPQNHWAGGIMWGGINKSEYFTDNNIWELGYSSSDTEPVAIRNIKLFDKISIGDKFAIKGYGGTNSLKIYFIGIVNEIDCKERRLFLDKICDAQFSIRPPGGKGGGNWNNAIVPVKREDMINLIFSQYPQKDTELNDIDLFNSYEQKNEKIKTVPFELNTIFYGPPGTGKTYHILKNIAPLFISKQQNNQKEKAVNLGQSLTWWETIAIVLMDKEKWCKVSEIMEHPLMKARVDLSTTKTPTSSIWGLLQNHTKESCESVNYKKRSAPLIFEKDKVSSWIVDKNAVEEQCPELLNILDEYKNNKSEEIKRYEFITFHQSFCYEDFIEGIKPVLSDETEDGNVRYSIENGIFKKMCIKAKNDPEHSYAIFIDEINRGNIAAIFGELITLLEQDKRLGNENEITVTLPYSKQKFEIPSNLYVFGTMNTADRSIEALDTALRRRFEFVELSPDSSLINNEVDDIDLKKLFEKINARIEFLMDRDHCIGHSYFMKITTFEQLKNVFSKKVIPLLEEYFFGDLAKIHMILGDKFIAKNKHVNVTILFGNADEYFDDKEFYTITNPCNWTTEDFKGLY